MSLRKECSSVEPNHLGSVDLAGQHQKSSSGFGELTGWTRLFLHQASSRRVDDVGRNRDDALAVIFVISADNQVS